MYTLYHFPISCSNVVKIVLELIDAEHKTINIDLYKGEQHAPEFLAINPQGKVPVLAEGERVLTQGSAILLHLSQKYSTYDLMPDLSSFEGATALKWLDFVSASMHSNFDKIFHADRISKDIEIVKANAEEQLVKQFQQVEKRLNKSKYLAGDKPTLADYYFVVMLGWEQVLSFDLLQRFPVFTEFKKALKEASPDSASLQAL